MHIFNFTEDYLKEHKSYFTAHEIIQQPRLWNEVFSSLQDSRQNVQEFLDRIIERYHGIRVIFTGAGTSAFVGETLAPIVRKFSTRTGLSFEAIPTTDIVSDPLSYLVKEQPTLIISFARSGNSPESVAAVELARKVIDDCYFITITCNSSGLLAKKAANDRNHLLLKMPDESNDKGFAMTSSFTCMLYASYLIFVPTVLDNESFHLNLLQTAQKFFKTCEKKITEVENYHFNRIIYLGSSALGKLTREAALKCLELNSGRMDTYYDSSMGFRHGPKSLQTNDTLIILFGSSEDYTKAYDRDMAKEIADEPLSSKLVILCADDEMQRYPFADQLVPFSCETGYLDNDLFRSMIYILFAQMFALHHSLLSGITPDNPSPDGKVNRVVKGVKIHPFN
ncbi:SIS domain-containing protein [Sporolactobacillus sp. THM7-4]|nr:SIS domain-containing protein [Sporolactobacillus sp. THM7-4]